MIVSIQNRNGPTPPTDAQEPPIKSIMKIMMMMINKPHSRTLTIALIYLVK